MSNTQQGVTMARPWSAFDGITWTRSFVGIPPPGKSDLRGLRGQPNFYNPTDAPFWKQFMSLRFCCISRSEDIMSDVLLIFSTMHVGDNPHLSKTMNVDILQTQFREFHSCQARQSQISSTDDTKT
uniref:Uncharacterized protein n=1 Tax=Entomoneis paludosa TaxID=265537 RepID=A0A7S2Y4M1_9STRA|mmetsp:Transcript_17372/g.36002  ORF Transcript_17372/g.36002 Transcript_17372/m.36002 type:complete len:126 (+) Transcript_17372:122-499(+)